MPVNWHWVADEVAYVLGDAEAHAVVVDDRFGPASWPRRCDTTATRSPAPVRAGDADLPEGFEAYEDLLASSRTGDIDDAQRGGPMFYTSGTTGWPKGVRSTLSTVGGPPEVLTLIAHSMAPLIGVPPGDRDVLLVCGPLYHSAQWVFGVLRSAAAPRSCCSTASTPRELLGLVDAPRRHQRPPRAHADGADAGPARDACAALRRVRRCRPSSTAPRPARTR